MRASGVRPCSFSARSETTSTAAEPSQIWLAEAALITPPSFSNLTAPIPSSVASKRMPSSIRWVSVPPSGSVDLDRHDLVVERPRLGRRLGAPVAFAAHIRRAGARS